MVRRSLVLFAVMTLGGWFGAARAQSVVDQQCQPPVFANYSIPQGTPIGQEFVPAMVSLTFVELWIVNFSSAQDDTATIHVVVHADSIQGPALATSAPVSIALGFDGSVRFDFWSVVTLVPGRKHVIEVRRRSGPGSPTLGLGGLTNCPGIRAIFQGEGFSSGADFWYRTGIDPTPARAATWGEIKQRYR